MRRCQLPARCVRISKPRVPITGLESRKSRLLPRFDAAKERLEVLIEPVQSLLKGVTAKFGKFGSVCLDLGQDILLIVITDRLACFAVSINAFLQRRIMQLTVQTNPPLQTCGLVKIRIEFVGDFAAFHEHIIPHTIS